MSRPAGIAPEIQDELGELFRYRPEAAAAAKAGGDWGPEPLWDVLEGYVYYCSDCETWHSERGGYEWGVIGGKPLVFWVSVDSDGDWKTSVALDPEVDNVTEQRERTLAAMQSDAHEYDKWVAERGEDPADVYFAPFVPEQRDPLRLVAQDGALVSVSVGGVAVADPQADPDLRAFLDLLPDGRIHGRTLKVIAGEGGAQADGSLVWEGEYVRRPAPSEDERRAHYRRVAAENVQRAVDAQAQAQPG